MIKGVTPVETAFELMGLMNSQAIMKWIFFDTFGGALIFAVGMVTSLAIAVEKGSFKAVWLFASLFFVTFFLFVIPTARVDGVTLLWNKVVSKGSLHRTLFKRRVTAIPRSIRF